MKTTRSTAETIADRQNGWLDCSEVSDYIGLCNSIRVWEEVWTVDRVFLIIYLYLQI